MTPAQVKSIQDSFTKVAPISEQAAGLFRGRLLVMTIRRKVITFQVRA